MGAALWIIVGALVLRLLGGVGFANYDTLYALVWGQQLSRGETPEYGISIANYILDPHEPHRPVGVPAGFTATRKNRSWVIFQRCAPAGGG